MTKLLDTCSESTIYDSDMESEVQDTYSRFSSQLFTTELTAEEERDRMLLERKVERAFYESGKALSELRNRRLYRNTHKTFEEYCFSRFGYNNPSCGLSSSACEARGVEEWRPSQIVWM